MTYENLYKSDIEDYVSKWKNKLSAADLVMPDNLSASQIAEALEVLPIQLGELKSDPPNHLSIDIASALDSKFEVSIKAFQEAKEVLECEYERKRREKYEQHQNTIKEANKVADESVSDLTKKYDRLLSNREKLTDAIVRYGIQPSDVELDINNLTKDDMDTLLDASLRVCDSLSDDKIRDRLSILYKENESHDQRLEHAIALIVGLVVLAPIALAALFGYMVFKVSKVYRNVGDLKIADKLMYGVDFSKFKDKPTCDESADIDYSDVDRWREEELARIERSSPHKAKNEIQSEITANVEKIDVEIKEAETHVFEMYSALIEKYESKIEELKCRMDEYLKNTALFPSVCSESFTMDTKSVLGREKGVIDVKYDLGLQNKVFCNKSVDMLMFVKLMLSNMLLSVRPRQLYITIYDTESLGADFSTFLSRDTQEYISIQTKDFSKVLDDHRNQAQANLRVLDMLDINEFNAAAEKKGMVTLDYKLLIIVSSEVKLTDNRLLTEFMQISAKAGVFVWLLSDVRVPGCKIYNKPFQDVAEPYPVSSDIFTKAVRVYVDKLANLKSAAILYQTVFGDKYIPKEKWWTENTDKGIKLNVGLQDGDPSKGFDLILGDGNPHCFVAGGTGSGKSGLLNQMLMSLLTRYPPSALELVMVDFKRAEFASLVDVNTHISKVPHAKIIAGTSDGDYALSIFDYLLEEMQRRAKLFESAGVKQLETYNIKMRQEGKVSSCLPRLMFIIDEFQQMFMSIDSKRLDKIGGRIAQLAKLARFCGCHMLFCSQSTSNSIPKDILDQYTMRIVLRCSSDVSGAVLGSDKASKIKVPQGYCYSNLAGGETQDSTRYWRIPLASEKVINEILADVMELCVSRNEKNHHAYFYDETATHEADQLMNWCRDQKQVLDGAKRIMVMGERTTFSLNKAPYNFKMIKSDGENILVYAFETVDFNNLIMTLVDNIQRDENASLLVNCADVDAYGMLDIESWYPEELVDTAKPTQDPTDWLNALEGMIEDRKESPSEEYHPVYVLAIRWDKQLGIYRESSYKLSERWTRILMNAPSVDIHIILGIQLYKELPTNTKVYFNHFIGAKGPEEASFRFADSNILAQLPSSLGFAVHQYSSSEYKFKIYQHKFLKEAEKRELVL